MALRAHVPFGLKFFQDDTSNVVAIQIKAVDLGVSVECKIKIIAQLLGENHPIASSLWIADAKAKDF